MKFRKCRPEPEETVDQFIFQMITYLEKWVGLANVDATFDGIKNVIIKEQVIDVSSSDLSTGNVFLVEDTYRRTVKLRSQALLVLH